MRTRLLIHAACAAAMCVVITVAARAQERKTENVVLVTLDGARWQEIFSGLDTELVRAGAPKDADVTKLPIYRRFWAPTVEERRSRLMPFLWNTLVAKYGSIAGNRTIGSRVSVTNRHWFSYPGYSEILTGQAHDDTIDTNDPKRNPYPSVLQFLRRKLGVNEERVATFASWYVFSSIVESEEGATTVNAGLQPYPDSSPLFQELNALMVEAATPWEGVRHDAFTMRFALEYLRRVKPRVLYIAFDETDDFAHDGHYDRVLESLHRIDEYLRTIWDEVQRIPEYRDRTSLVITADHGRGRTVQDWRNHGAKVPGADEIWIAFASPDSARRGEWRDHQPWFQNQIASTIAALFGFDYREQNPDAGAAISELLMNR